MNKILEPGTQEKKNELAHSTGRRKATALRGIPPPTSEGRSRGGGSIRKLQNDLSARKGGPKYTS